MSTMSAVEAIAGQSLQLREEIEAQRKLPEPIVDALIESGVCRLAHPEALGGAPWDPDQALDVLDTLAQADASVAWIVWNNWLPAMFARWLGDETRTEVLADSRQLLASSTRPSGKLVVDGDDFRLSGRWALVSGCQHADWIGLMALVEDEGEMRMLAPDMPELRFAYIPKHSCHILDTWHVGGLRGTGSHDITVQDLAVPTERTARLGDPGTLDEPIGHLPIAVTMAAGHAAICLGIARAVLDAAVELGRTKTSPDPGPDMRDVPAHQYAVAEAAGLLDAHHLQLRHSADQLCRMARAGDQPTADDLAPAWSAAITAQQAARHIVRELYSAAGTTALYTSSVLERCHRDLHAAMQHVIAQPRWLEESGRVRFGMQPSSPLYAL